MKKLTSILLAVILTISVISTTTVFAEEPTPTPTETVETLTSTEEATIEPSNETENTPITVLIDKINALPSIDDLEAMSAEDQEAVQTSLTSIMNEIDTLSDDDYQTLMDTIDNDKWTLIQSISDFFAGQVNPLDNGSGFGVVNATSQIGGVNFVNTGTSGTVSFNAAAGTNGTINVKFPVGVTDGSIKISVPLGVKWIFEGDMNEKGSASGVPNSQTMITTAAGDQIPMEDYTWQYTVNPNMTEFAITNFTLIQNTMYAGRTLPSSEQIKVEVSYNGALQDTVYINSIDLTTLGTAGSSITPTQSLFTGTGDSVIIGGDNAPGANTMYFTNGNVKDIGIVESLVTKVTPTSITPSGDMTKGVFENLDTTHWTMTGPDLSGTYTFTANLGQGSIWSGNGSPTGSPAFKITYPSVDFNDGDKISYKITSTGTFLGGIVAPAIDDQTFYVELLPQQVSLTTNIYDLQSAITNGINTQDITYPAPFGDGNGSTGFLGGYYIGNKGGLDSGPTKVSLDFDSTIIGVRGLRVIWPFFDGNNDGNNDITLTDVTYTTTTNSTPQAYTGTITDYGDNTGIISPTMFGLNDGEYLTNVTYKLSSIPSASAYRNASHDANYRCYWEAAYFGDVLQVGQQATTTVSLIDAGTNTVLQSGKVFTNTSDTNGSIYPWMQQNVAMSSGGSSNVTVGFRSDPISYGSTTNPIFYIRNPSDAVIDTSTITITDKYGTVITASDLVITKYTDPADPDAKEIVKIDTSNITDGTAVYNSQDCEVGTVAYENAFDGANGVLAFHMDTPVTAQSGTYLWRDMLYIEDPDHSVLVRNDGTANDHFTVGSSFHNISSATGGYIAGLPSLKPATANNTFLKIDGRSDMAVTNAIKYSTEPDSKYTTYSSNNEFLIMDPPTTTDLKISLTNATGINGKVLAGTTLYLPIPKEGEDWGALMNTRSQQFQFSTELTAPMTNPSPATYDIFYGTVTPTDSSTTLEGYTTFESYNAANAANYNCIKFVQKQDTNYKTVADPGKTLVETNTTNFVATLKLTASDSLADEQLDIWAPYYHEIYQANGGDYGSWLEGEEVALSTALGQIEGTIWLDDNADGIQQASETGLPSGDKDGWTIKIYEKTDFDANGVTGATELGKVVTGDTTVIDPSNPGNPLSPAGSGYYRFDKLDRTKKYVITAENTTLAGKYYFTVLGTSSDKYMNNTYVNQGTYAASNADAGDTGASATRQVQKQAAGEVNAAKNGIYPLGLTPPIFKTASTPEDTLGTVGQINSTITYTIHYTNNTASTATIEITDLIPDGTQLNSIPTGATGYSDTAMTTTTTTASEVKALKWTKSGVLADQTGSVDFTVTVKDTLTTSAIKNKANVKVGATNVETNEVKTYIPSKKVTSQSDSLNGAYETIGKTLTYTIAYRNTDSTPGPVEITDVIPTNTVLTSIPTGAVGYSDTAMTTTTTTATEVKALKWSLTNVPVDVDRTVSFTTTVTDAAFNTTVKNKANVKIGTNNPSTTNEVSTFIEGKKVSSGVDTTTGSLSMAVTDTITYTIAYKNIKDVNKTIVITDVLPANTVLTAIPANATGYSDAAMTTVTTTADEVKALKWTLAAVTPGTNSTVSFSVKPTKDAIQTELKNSASIQIEGDTAVTTNEVKTYVQGKKVTTASDATNGLWELVGGNINYTIAYKNTYSTAQDVTITDVLPANTVLTSIPTGAIGYSDAAMTTTTTNAAEVKALKWTKTAVAANTAGTVTFTLTANDSALGTWINNTGKVQVGTGNPTQDTNIVSTYIVGKRAESDVDTTGQTVVIGGTINYYVSYINTESTAKDIIITDELPANTELVTIPVGAIGYTDNTLATTTTDPSAVKVLQWTKSSVASHSGGRVDFSVKVLDAALDTSIQNEATIKIDNNTITTNTTDTYAAGKSVDKDQANASDTLTYTIYYKNNELAAATITVTDEIPLNTTLVTIPTGAIGYSDTSMTTVTTVAADVKALKWEITAVPAGTTDSVTFDVTVLDAAQGTTIPNVGKFKVDNNPEIDTNTVLTDISSPTIDPTPGPFLVTYLDCYGNTVKIEWVSYGGSSAAPNSNFSDVSNVTAHIEVKQNNCGVTTGYKVPNTADHK